MAVDLPTHFVARPYQIPFLKAVEMALTGESEKRFFIQVWHRRAGKDKVNIADVIPRRLIQDPCLVKYVYPTLVNGRQNMWDAMGKDGFRYLDHIPQEIRDGRPNETLMKMPVKNNTPGSPSLLQIAGSDHPDSLRGGNAKLMVFSEWSEQDPYSWDVVEPILRENNGIAIFNYTPKGNNHAKYFLDYAKDSPLWWTQVLTVNDTGIFSPTEIEEIRRDIIARFASDGRSEDEAITYFNQEYMCSFEGSMIGAYYSANIAKAEEEHRITSVPYERSLPVETAWDLGMDDSMSIWFYQTVGMEIHIIDYYENSGEGLAHYAQVLQDRKYIYKAHHFPHDIAVRELGTGKSRFEVAQQLGLRPLDTAPRLGVDEGINAARSIFNQCWFDKVKCMRGLNCLKNYRKEWNERNKIFRNTPMHDWSSHGADSFRTFATSYKRRTMNGVPISTDPTRPYGGVKPYLEGIG